MHVVWFEKVEEIESKERNIFGEEYLSCGLAELRSISLLIEWEKGEGKKFFILVLILPEMKVKNSIEVREICYN